MYKKKASLKGNYAFIDSQNLNLGTQKMGWKMDWRKFRKLLESKYGVTRAFMFIGYVAENEPMYDQLHDSGYTVVLKRILEAPTVAAQPDDSEVKTKDVPKVKGNVDVDLVLYVMKELPNYKKAILVSGDGDFESLVEYLVNKKRLLNLMVPNWQYSSLLKPHDKFIVRLDKMHDELAYRVRRKNK